MSDPMLKAYFCIVQYCPDIARREVANVGVLLFSPEHQFLEVRMTQDDRRERQFFGDATDLPGHLATMKSALQERLTIERSSFKTFDDLQRFADTRANKIVLTSPRAVMITRLETDLDRLFTQLVEPKPRTMNTDKPSSHAIPLYMSLTEGFHVCYEAGLSEAWEEHGKPELFRDMVAITKTEEPGQRTTQKDWESCFRIGFKTLADILANYLRRNPGQVYHYLSHYGMFTCVEARHHCPKGSPYTDQHLDNIGYHKVTVSWDSFNERFEIEHEKEGLLRLPLRILEQIVVPEMRCEMKRRLKDATTIQVLDGSAFTIQASYV